MNYTVHDTPEVVERIERDLDDVTQAVRAVDPGLLAIVLTGAFARGEGAVRNGQPQNDYDLIALRRGVRPPRGYDQVRQNMEERLGLHIDLAPVSSWRLRFVQPSIFWYETALRGHVVHGPDLLDRIPIRSPQAIDPREGLRLLANRSAGLLLATSDPRPDERRLQASKGLLAALDARLLALGRFPPTQTERWASWCDPTRPRQAIDEEAEEWFAWAYQYKVDPTAAGVPDADVAWRAAARAIRDALPIALRHAGFRTLQEYGRQDGFIDRAYFLLHLARAPKDWRLAWNPTSHVRVTTLRILLDHLDHIDEAVVGNGHDHLTGSSANGLDLDGLERLRGATLQ